MRQKDSKIRISATIHERFTRCSCLSNYMIFTRIFQMTTGENSGGATYCVTGATGFIGSWLVMSLLEKGHRVHATFRDPEKVDRLISLWGSSDQLKLFEADLNKEGSFDEAINGCTGIFHVAASMEFDFPMGVEDIENYVRSEILQSAITGTLNLLKSCLRSNSVKRVVFTSSISTISGKDGDGQWRKSIDESSQTPVDTIWRMKSKGWVYVLSKLFAEDAAFRFAEEKGIDLVSIIPSTVAGPFLTSSVPSSIQVLLSPITGDSKFFHILKSVYSRLGSISLVHIEDVCNAHMFLMNRKEAEGRYICSVQSCSSSKLSESLVLECPNSKAKSFDESHGHGAIPSISSKKLTDLGFQYKHCLQEIIRQSVRTCVERRGFQKFPEKETTNTMNQRYSYCSKK